MCGWSSRANSLRFEGDRGPQKNRSWTSSGKCGDGSDQIKLSDSIRAVVSISWFMERFFTCWSTSRMPMGSSADLWSRKKMLVVVSSEV